MVGPHFESPCREYNLRAGAGLFGAEVGEVLTGTVADPANRTRIELDVVVFAPTQPDPTGSCSSAWTSWLTSRDPYRVVDNALTGMVRSSRSARSSAGGRPSVVR